VRNDLITRQNALAEVVLSITMKINDDKLCNVVSQSKIPSQDDGE